MVPSKSSSPVTPVMSVSPFSMPGDQSSTLQKTIGTPANSAARLSTTNSRAWLSAQMTMSKRMAPSRRRYTSA